MTSQVIPAQAVEAAAKELYKTAPFPLEHDDHVGILRILEAAAPHMLAAAWAEGHSVGRTDEWSLEPNPYRSQP